MDRLDFSQGVEKAINAAIMGVDTRTETRKAKGKQGVAETRRSGFSQVLEHSIFETRSLGPLPSTDPSEEAIQELLDEVRSSADILKRRQLPDEILQYKKSVRNFLHYVVENGFEIKPSLGIKKKVYVGGEKTWKQIPYQQVNIIDRKLEELASGILLKQINDLDLNAKLEEITGMLVDLTISGKILTE